MVAVIGLTLTALVIAAVLVWYRSYRLREEPPPPDAPDDTPQPRPPADRSEEWDPRARYD